MSLVETLKVIAINAKSSPFQEQNVNFALLANI